MQLIIEVPFDSRPNPDAPSRFVEAFWKRGVAHFLQGIWGNKRIVGEDGVTLKLGTVWLVLDATSETFSLHGEQNDLRFNSPKPSDQKRVQDDEKGYFKFLEVGASRLEVMDGLARFMHGYANIQITIEFPDGKKLTLWKSSEFIGIEAEGLPA